MEKNPVKMDDLGVPLFLETPICSGFFRGGETQISGERLSFASKKSMITFCESWEPKGTPPMPPPQEIRPY